MDSMSFLIVYYDMACIDFSIALSLVGVPVTTMGHQANACIDGWWPRRDCGCKNYAKLVTIRILLVTPQKELDRRSYWNLLEQ